MTTLPGYLGQILRVDLTQPRAWAEPLNADYARRFLGGSGLGARYLWDYVTADTDPLGPDNPLIFMTGPFVGTTTPAAGRFSVVTRSPATRLTGEGNSGGFFGPAMRQAGFDGIIITGQAQAPVYLSIVNGEAALHDASHLWGLDSYAVQEQVKAEISQPKARVACIGPAGERLVKFAAVMNDHGRCAARTGLGAVMDHRGYRDTDPGQYYPTAAAYTDVLERAGFTDVNARIVPRPTLLPGRMADWLRTFRQGYLDAAGVPVGEQDALVAETCVVLEPALRDPATGRWYADYVRLRATARRPA